MNEARVLKTNTQVLCCEDITKKQVLFASISVFFLKAQAISSTLQQNSITKKSTGNPQEPAGLWPSLTETKNPSVNQVYKLRRTYLS